MMADCNPSFGKYLTGEEQYHKQQNTRIFYMKLLSLIILIFTFRGGAGLEGTVFVVDNISELRWIFLKNELPLKIIGMGN